MSIQDQPESSCRKCLVVPVSVGYVLCVGFNFEIVVQIDVCAFRSYVGQKIQLQNNMSDVMDIGREFEQANLKTPHNQSNVLKLVL